MKIHTTCVSDDYFNQNDLTDAVAKLVPQFDLLVSLPPATGLAGWLRYRFNPERKYLVLCRRYYPARLTDRFPVPGTEAGLGSAAPRLLEAMQETARRMDFTWMAVEDYHRTGSLYLDSLSVAQERQAVARALARDPLARFPSCLEFVNTLQLSASSAARR